MIKGNNSTSRHHRKTQRKALALATAGLLLSPTLQASGETTDNVALKTNLLYDAATTPNLGIEVGLGVRNSLQLFYGLNPWKFGKGDDQRYAKHWVVMPEFRWWTCTKFNGHFFGVHLLGGEYNAANISLPIPGFFFGGDNLRSGIKESRYQGWMAGAGATYGYQWILSKHWNLEAEIGVGYIHAWYDRYPCYECGTKISSGNTNYAGITKLGVSLLYIF